MALLQARAFVAFTIEALANGLGSARQRELRCEGSGRGLDARLALKDMSTEAAEALQCCSKMQFGPEGNILENLENHLTSVDDGMPRVMVIEQC